MNFSQRHGYNIPKSIVEKETASTELRTAVWNTLLFILFRNKFISATATPTLDHIYSLGKYFYADVVKWPIDTLPANADAIFKKVRAHFFSSLWYEFYDFLEWLLSSVWSSDQLIEAVNDTLKQNLSGYRFIENQITPITDENELNSIQEAMSHDNFESARTHLSQALIHLSNKESPDYRNSIKESISAVEATLLTLTNKSSGDFKPLLSEVFDDRPLHPALREGFVKIYGYTSDGDGIRHAALETPSVDIDDAKYFLVTCSSFINYLISKTPKLSEPSR